MGIEDVEKKIDMLKVYRFRKQLCKKPILRNLFLGNKSRTVAPPGNLSVS